MMKDKKAESKKISLIVAKEIGKVEKLSNIDSLQIKKALQTMQKSQ